MTSSNPYLLTLPQLMYVYLKAWFLFSFYFTLFYLILYFLYSNILGSSAKKKIGKIAAFHDPKKNHLLDLLHKPFPRLNFASNSEEISPSLWTMQSLGLRLCYSTKYYSIHQITLLSFINITIGWRWLCWFLRIH